MIFASNTCQSEGLQEERLIDSCSHREIREIIAFRHGRKFTREPPRVCTREFSVKTHVVSKYSMS